MSVANFAAFVLLPTVIDGPGTYWTRCGEPVIIQSVMAGYRFGCLGYYEDDRTRDAWHTSGRLLFNTESANDIVSKAKGEDHA